MGLFASILALVLLLAGCCSAPPAPEPDGGACSITDCPVGAFDQCEPEDTIAPCCQGGAVFQACARPAGRLVHNDDCAAACSSLECAVSPAGVMTCCMLDAPDDPCGAAVP